MRTSLSLIVVLAAAACNAKPQPLEVTPAKATAQGAPPATDTSATNRTATQGAQAPAAAGALRGKLVERIDAPPYSYLKIATPAGEVWAAVNQTQLGAGAEVTIDSPLPMRDFESKSLHRTFPLVYFGMLAGATGATGPTGPTTTTPPTPTAAPPASPAAPAAAVHVERAKGKDARTIAEIYAHKAELKDKRVVLRGQVVKYNGGILGKNWLHVHDGSGAQARGDDDLTVTSADATKVGDVITITGTLRLGKDFGSGYAYPVMIEEASLKVE